jgi:photosystem II stability/assembly factor-like uncharacterized protein
MLFIVALMAVVFVGGYKYLAKIQDAQDALAPAKAIVYNEKQINLFSITSPGGGLFFAVGEKGTFLVSHDGGDSWQGSKPLVTGENLASVYFKNEMEGWVVGTSGTFLHTNDGGGKWETLDLGTKKLLKKILFTDENHGVIIGEESSYYYTVNGGSVWQKGLSGITEETYDDPFALEMFNDICFAKEDKAVGWIVGEMGLVLKTEDGGDGWIEQKLPVDVNFNSVVVLDKDRAWIGGQQGFLFSTADGGKTWKQVKIFIGQSIEPVKQQIFKVKLLPFGEGGYSLSEDRAWHVYVLGVGLAVNSYDYGAGWRVITLNQELGYSWLYDLCHLGRERACMVGKNGVIFKTKDKGLLWERSYY